MSIKICLFFCLLIEAIALFFYCKTIFVPKKKLISSIFLYFVGYIFLFIIHSFENINSLIINVLSFFFINLLIISLLYKINLISCFVQSCILTFLSILAETVTGYVCSHLLSPDFFNNWNSNLNLVIMSSSVLVYVLMLTCVAFLQIHIHSKEFSEKKEFLIILIISICITLVLAICFMSLLIGTPTKHQINSTTACMALLTAIQILIIFLYNYMRKSSLDLSYRQKQLQIESDSQILIEEINNRELSQRILIHDIKNHLSSIASLSNDENAVKQYINNLLESPALKPTVKYCSNDFINAILYRYTQYAKDKNVKFNIETSNVELDFISKNDLTIIFGNLLDNAFEACILCDNPTVNLIISYDTMKNISIIKLSNSCQNKTVSVVGKTTKINSSIHGYGLLSVQKALERNNGHIQQYINENTCQYNTIIIFSRGFYENNNL